MAAGTSVPVFDTALVAAYKGYHGMSVGNLIGSDIFIMFGVNQLKKDLQVENFAKGTGNALKSSVV